MSPKFTRRSILGAGAALASVPLIGRSARAQAWKPTKPVRVICTYAAGSFAHLCIAEINKAFDLKIEAVHYRGETPMWTDLAGRSLHGAIGGPVPALNLVDAGKAWPVAMLSKKRVKKMPDVPTYI